MVYAASLKEDVITEINEYANENNCKFSLYVDDMIFSSEK